MPTNHYKVVLIDDEPDAIEVVNKLIESINSISLKVAGTAGNLEEGLALIEEEKPDIVFLDIEMPGQNGLAIYDYYPNPEFKVIFVTAYQQYAIEALKKSASDYLLKPINFVELKDALKKVVNELERDEQDEEFRDKINYLNSIEIEGKNILLDVEGGFIMENTRNIEYCLAEQSYSTIVTYAKKEFMVSKSLKGMQELLPRNQFYRTHKSYLVNIHFIRKFVRGNESYLILKSGVRIPVSVRVSSRITKEIRQMLSV